MVKTLISMACVIAILAGGCAYETKFIQNEFTELHQTFTVLYDKVDGKTATQDDVISAQSKWLNTKRYLHAFIPHNEIKEIDLWLAEAVTLVRDKKWEDAVSKITVLIELTEQIPQTFSISFENIF